MRNRAINALLEMEIPADLKGFNYICTAMELLQDEKIRSGGTIELYNIIASKHNATMSGVERGIRRAFSVALDKRSKAAKRYFSGCRITNGSLLAVLYVRLEQERERDESKS